MRRVLLISFGITILPKSSTRRTIPVAFIYLSPFPRQRPPCLKGAVTEGDWGIDAALRQKSPAGNYPSTAYAVPLPLGEGGFYAYNNFTNYAVSICKRQEIIPQDLLFQAAVI